MTGGRPTKYNEVVATEILRRMAEERASIRKICEDPDMPSSTTIYEWCRVNPEFSARYARAMEDRNHTLAQEIIDIADDKTIKPDDKRIMVDARKWLASKMLPKNYGDKIEHVGKDGEKLETNTITQIEWIIIDHKPKEDDSKLIDHEELIPIEK